MNLPHFLLDGIGDGSTIGMLYFGKHCFELAIFKLSWVEKGHTDHVNREPKRRSLFTFAQLHC